MVLMINTYCVCCLRLCLHRLNKPAFRVLNYFSTQVLCLFCWNSWFSSPEHYDKCSIRTTWCKKEGRNENTIRQTRLCHYVSWSITSTQLWQTLWFETAHLLAEYSSEVLIWLEHLCFIQIYALLDSILLLKLVKTCFLFPFPFPQKKYPLSCLQKYYLVNEVVYRPRQMHKIINPGDVWTSKVLERIYRSVDFQ